MENIDDKLRKILKETKKKTQKVNSNKESLETTLEKDSANKSVIKDYQKKLDEDYSDGPTPMWPVVKETYQNIKELYINYATAKMAFVGFGLSTLMIYYDKIPYIGMDDEARIYNGAAIYLICTGIGYLIDKVKGRKDILSIKNKKN